MMNRLLCIFAYICICYTVVSSQGKITTETINWEQFMSQHDMYWDRITNDYYAGAIMGNGLLGTNLYKLGNGYRFDIGRVDVTEGRGALSDEVYPYKVGNLYDNGRLPIGYFTLMPIGTVTAEKMRLSLYNAINKGTISTDKGSIEFKSYVHATKNYIVFESKTTGEETNYTWQWNALRAVSPRIYATGISHPSNYSDYTSRPNPAVEIKKEGDYNLSVQKLLSGKTYVVAWKEIIDGENRRIIITVSQEDTTENAIQIAKQTIDDCIGTTIDSLETMHKEWWHNYYPESFISFGNSKMESFYWTQIYKFASATRKDKFIVDLQGPWATEKTPWPAIWMNLNIQLTYSWMYTANRSELSEPVWKALNDNIENLKNNVSNPAWREEAIAMGRSTSYHMKSFLDPALASANQYEVGNLPWLLFYYWQYCVYNNKQDELVTKFFPLLKKSIAYYAFIREVGADGKYHLPVTASPEYKAAADCNYDLALLRWGLQMLLDLNTTYNLGDEKESHWTDFLENLVDYPIDATRGYMIGKNVNLTSSHRHYSHLLMIYPLYTVNWEQKENQALITKSINNWQSLTGALQGYSFTGSSAMYSSMGDGARATKQLESLLDRYIKPNTLYAETGPVIETPLSAVASLHDLYVQSWGDKIRVFPAVPATWEKASFINLRTQGAFLISASREEGKTVWIQVESEAGGSCRLQTGMNLSQIKVQTLSGQNIAFNTLDVALGLIEFNTSAGDIIVITDSTLSVVYPTPVEHPRTEANPYGVNDGPDIPLENISLPAEVTVSAENPKVPLTPTFLPEGAKNTTVFWESNNEEVVTVFNGLLIPHSRGEATVTATTADGVFQADCLVKVTDNFQSFELKPLADSYVRDNSGTLNTNYGSEELIIIKKDDAGYNREGFFKFSIADLSTMDLSQKDCYAVVSLYMESTGNSANTANIQVRPVDNITWIESGQGGITWNNKPATTNSLLCNIPGSVVTSPVFNSSNFFSFDITNYILSQQAKNKNAISFNVFQNQRGSGGGGTVNLASKENSTVLMHPRMVIITYDKPVGIDNLSSSDKELLVYPSITKDWITLVIQELTPIYIHYANGVLVQTIYPQSIGKTEINIGGYPSGIYFVTINNNVYKIVKQ